MKKNDYTALYYKEMADYIGVIEYPNGTKEWYFKGARHRLDGPAVIYSNGTKLWYFEGKIHRTDGPAIQWHDGSASYYYHGIQTTKEAIELLNNLLKFREMSCKQ